MAGRPAAEWTLLTLKELKDWLRDQGAESYAAGARLLKVTPQTLTKWASGEGAPSEANQRRILARMGRTDQIPEPRTTFEQSPREIAAQLLKMADEVTDPRPLMLAAGLLLEREKGADS